jgi:hypothetical protein
MPKGVSRGEVVGAWFVVYNRDWRRLMVRAFGEDDAQTEAEARWRAYGLYRKGGATVRAATPPEIREHLLSMGGLGMVPAAWG